MKVTACSCELEIVGVHSIITSEDTDFTAEMEELLLFGKVERTSSNKYCTFNSKTAVACLI